MSTLSLAVCACLALSARPARSEDAKAGIRWATIPGGDFSMGAGAEESRPESKPAHRVAIKSFQMSKTMVTNKQYAACVAAGACAPAHFSDGTCYAVWNGRKWEKGMVPPLFRADEQPVVCVDWAQAKAFAKWAGGRLPSEAEWEYAARGAGKDRKYPWGNEDATCERAVMSEGGAGCGRNATWPVCSKPKGNTEQGLCDMAGNAWEWLEDYTQGDYHGAPTDGSAWEVPATPLRAARGGSWHGASSDARTTFRGHAAPDRRGANLGLRLAR